MEAEGTLGRRAVVPLPFVRKLRLHMDSCPGTNKSQFFFGGLGLMLSVGLLDCAMVVFMMVGHTKFGPDLVARQVAGHYNTADAFNHGQLVRLMTPYATAGAYGDNVLHTWKAGSDKLFAPVGHIMSYRGFLLLADDGKVQLGSPATPDVTEFEPFEDSGPLYADAKLMMECERAAYRSLKEDVFPSLRMRAYHGVGRAAVSERCQDSGGALLLPDTVPDCRKVRLFTRRHANESYWREKVNWMKDASVSAVNAALASVRPHKDHPELHKEAYGAKAKSTREMYAEYVPREYVPDRCDTPGRQATAQQSLLPESVVSGAGAASQQTMPASTQASQTEASGTGVRVTKKVRWSAAVCMDALAAALLGPPFNGDLPQKLTGWTQLAAKMPAPSVGEEWDVQTLKRHAKMMAEARADIRG